MILRPRRVLLVAAPIGIAILAGCRSGTADAGRAIRPDSSVDARGRRVIILAIDGVDLSMLRAESTRNLRRMISEEAAVGLMSRRSPGDRWQRHVSMWATLGAGRAAASGPRSAAAKPGSARKHVIDMGPVREANRRYHTLAQPGALGEAVRRAGLTTAVACEARGDSLWLTSLVGADYSGNVDCAVYREPLDPGARVFDRCEQANLVVVDFAGTRQADRADERHHVFAQAVVLWHADGLVEDFVSRLRPGRDLLIVLSPTGPSYPRASERAMGPVIVVGAGSGLLTGRSTRREGVVAAVDIAPTALAWLGLETPPEMTGRPMAVLPAADASSRVRWLDRRISATFAERFVIVPIASAAEVGIIIILAVWWLLRPESARRRRIGRAGPLLGYALPLALLPLPWFGIRPVGEVVAVWLVLSLIIAGAAYRLGPLVGPASLNAAGAALIAADLIAGGEWLRYSVMGSDTIIGGRFYGMGNERAGLFVCSLALAAGFAVQRWGWRASSRAIVGLAFAGGVALVGLPVLGANWGSAIVVTVGLGLASPRLGAPRLRARQVGAIAAAAVLVGIGLIVIDGWWDNGRSHIGSATGFLLAGDVGAAWATYARKMANNWALLGLSPLVMGFLAMIGAMVYLLARPPARLAAALSRYRVITGAVVGCLAAMCVGMVVNDTGSVAAAIIGIMVMQTLVYLVLLPGESDASTRR